MEGLSIIEDRALKSWEARLSNIEQHLLGLMKKISEILPPAKQSNIPDFISIADATTKYHISRVTINNKIRLFKKAKGREIDRIQSGNFNLINEAELQEAIRLKSTFLLIRKSKK